MCVCVCVCACCWRHLRASKGGVAPAADPLISIDLHGAKGQASEALLNIAMDESLPPSLLLVLLPRLLPPPLLH